MYDIRFENVQAFRPRELMEDIAAHTLVSLNTLTHEGVVNFPAQGFFCLFLNECL